MSRDHPSRQQRLHQSRRQSRPLRPTSSSAPRRPSSSLHKPRLQVSSAGVLLVGSYPVLLAAGVACPLQPSTQVTGGCLRSPLDSPPALRSCRRWLPQAGLLVIACCCSGSFRPQCLLCSESLALACYCFPAGPAGILAPTVSAIPAAGGSPVQAIVPTTAGASPTVTLSPGEPVVYLVVLWPVNTLSCLAGDCWLACKISCSAKEYALSLPMFPIGARKG